MFDGFVKHLDLLRWLGFKGKPRAVRKPDGYTITRGPHGERVDADTLQCCHCGSHEEIVAGSGRERGWCLRHNAFVCGRPMCMAFCMDKEQRLENLERGLPEMTVPTAAVFGELGPKAKPMEPFATEQQGAGKGAGEID